MAVSWTKEQQQVISLRNRNILVSAAAGSGKTAVLVERILTLITDTEHPTDIDSLLIVTFTRAAAAEMKERIRAAVEKRLEQDPDNEHLQRQSTLIHHAQINTIDGFCAHILRNYFHMIDLDPAYRTAEDGELKLLKHDVMEEVLEAAYAKNDEQFLNFVECYAAGKNDNELEKQVLKLFEYSMSYPWPKQWLEGCKQFYQMETCEELKEAPWMKLALEDTGKLLKDARGSILQLLEICDRSDGPYMYRDALESDLRILDNLQNAKEYDEYAALLESVKYARLSGKKDAGVSETAKKQVQEGRKEFKALLGDLKDSYFYAALDEILESIQKCREPVCALIDLTIAFLDAFAEKKREKNLVDFADMEHFALDILVRNEDGQLVYSQAAEDFADQFSEIFIDEYQDSNLVQETILTAVSRIRREQYNLFMVGDVKQSIYRFRLARPELFMEKFHSYTLTDSSNQRIDLHKNFRSRSQVLSVVNYIFYQIMGEDLGKVEYDNEAALYPGASFPEGNSEEFAATELLLVDTDSELLEEIKGAQTSRELEALAVAERIQNIVGKELVLDRETGEYRPARYGDIVILLRTMAGWSETFGEVLGGQGIPTYSASKTGYFSALEVVTVLNYLHILDNPRQDIPFAAVLHSPVVGCSPEEMAMLRTASEDKKSGADYYSCVMDYLQNGDSKELQEKLKCFWKDYEELRSLVPYTPIHELILKLLEKTHYADYAAAMPAGEQREANLNMLVERAMEFEKTSYRGLFNFIRYIEHMQKYDVDYGEVNLSGGDNVVQLMSIHKSKGLEFPIVFLSGMSKQFNQQDINAGLVIHQDLGIGADCIDPKLRIRFPTVMKQVLRRQLKQENQGEELRVLYVAMTRAKEKLIMTGTVDKLEKAVLSCHRISGRKETKLSYGLLEKGKSYLDWVLPALARHPAFRQLYKKYGLAGNVTGKLLPDEPDLSIRVLTPAKLVENQIEQQVQEQMDKETFRSWDSDTVYVPELKEQLENRFSYAYPHAHLRDIPVKVTVSDLKKRGYEEEDISYEVYFEPDVIPLIPEFIKDSGKEEYKGAQRGTAYHRLLECLDFERSGSLEQIEQQIGELTESRKLEKQEAECISSQQIFDFVNSSLGQRMAAAEKNHALYREQPFVIAQKASAVKSRWGEEETILVQGIIDVYFQEGDNLILADYKTDSVKSAKELKEHYHIQLEQYADALERLTGKKVKEKMIYSFTLGCSIEL